MSYGSDDEARTPTTPEERPCSNIQLPEETTSAAQVCSALASIRSSVHVSWNAPPPWYNTPSGAAQEATAARMFGRTFQHSFPMQRPVPPKSSESSEETESQTLQGEPSTSAQNNSQRKQIAFSRSTYCNVPSPVQNLSSSTYSISPQEASEPFRASTREILSQPTRLLGKGPGPQKASKSERASKKKKNVRSTSVSSRTTGVTLQSKSCKKIPQKRKKKSDAPLASQGKLGWKIHPQPTARERNQATHSLQSSLTSGSKFRNEMLWKRTRTPLPRWLSENETKSLETTKRVFPPSTSVSYGSRSTGSHKPCNELQSKCTEKPISKLLPGRTNILANIINEDDTAENIASTISFPDMNSQEYTPSASHKLEMRSLNPGQSGNKVLLEQTESLLANLRLQKASKSESVPHKRIVPRNEPQMYIPVRRSISLTAYKHVSQKPLTSEPQRTLSDNISAEMALPGSTVVVSFNLPVVSSKTSQFTKQTISQSSHTSEESMQLTNSYSQEHERIVEKCSSSVRATNRRRKIPALQKDAHKGAGSGERLHSSKRAEQSTTTLDFPSTSKQFTDQGINTSNPCVRASFSHEFQKAADKFFTRMFSRMLFTRGAGEGNYISNPMVYEMFQPNRPSDGASHSVETLPHADHRVSSLMMEPNQRNRDELTQRSVTEFLASSRSEHQQLRPTHRISPTTLAVVDRQGGGNLARMSHISLGADGVSDPHSQAALATAASIFSFVFSAAVGQVDGQPPSSGTSKDPPSPGAKALQRSESDDRLCRICQDSQGDLDSFCNCKGTMGLVHRECLQRWLCEARRVRCELCGFVYNLQLGPRYTSTRRALVVWLCHHAERRQLLLDAVVLALFSPVAGCLLWLAVHMGRRVGVDKAGWPSDGPAHLQLPVIVMLAAAGVGACSTWLALALRSHYRAWRDWYYRQITIRVLPKSVAPEGGRRTLLVRSVLGMGSETEHAIVLDAFGSRAEIRLAGSERPASSSSSSHSSFMLGLPARMEPVLSSVPPVPLLSSLSFSSHSGASSGRSNDNGPQSTDQKSPQVAAEACATGLALQSSSRPQSVSACQNVQNARPPSTQCLAQTWAATGVAPPPALPSHAGRHFDPQVAGGWEYGGGDLARMMRRTERSSSVAATCSSTRSFMDRLQLSELWPLMTGSSSSSTPAGSFAESDLESEYIYDINDSITAIEMGVFMGDVSESSSSPISESQVEVEIRVEDLTVGPLSEDDTTESGVRNEREQTEKTESATMPEKKP